MSRWHGGAHQASAVGSHESEWSLPGRSRSRFVGSSTRPGPEKHAREKELGSRLALEFGNNLCKVWVARLVQALFPITLKIQCHRRGIKEQVLAKTRANKSAKTRRVRTCTSALL